MSDKPIVPYLILDLEGTDHPDDDNVLFAKIRLPYEHTRHLLSQLEEMERYSWVGGAFRVMGYAEHPWEEEVELIMSDPAKYNEYDFWGDPVRKRVLESGGAIVGENHPPKNSVITSKHKAKLLLAPQQLLWQIQTGRSKIRTLCTLQRDLLYALCLSAPAEELMDWSLKLAREDPGVLAKAIIAGGFCTDDDATPLRKLPPLTPEMLAPLLKDEDRFVRELGIAALASDQFERAQVGDSFVPQQLEVIMEDKPSLDGEEKLPASRGRGA